MTKMNKFLTGLSALALVFTLSACSEEQTTVQEVEKVEKVQVMKLTSTVIEREVVLPTTLEGYDNMKISSSVSGIINDILVDVGDKVSKGQVLVKMDPTQYTTTKLQYANLGVEMGRMEALKEAIYNGVSSLKYIETILYNWRKKGYKTKAEVRDAKNKYYESKKEQKEEKEIFYYDWLNDD